MPAPCAEGVGCGVAGGSGKEDDVGRGSVAGWSPSTCAGKHVGGGWVVRVRLRAAGDGEGGVVADAAWDSGGARGQPQPQGRRMGGGGRG